MKLESVHRERLLDLLRALVDQSGARVLVPPYRNAPGFWFGGGNVVRAEDGTLWLCGRYRNYGDSRTGLAAGERGLECALFAGADDGGSFRKVRSWSKADLSRPEAEVVSIEGTSLHRRSDGTWELFVSSEKAWEYPAAVREFRKPGSGVWSIDVLRGQAPGTLDAASLAPVLREEDPGHLHVKDPVVFDDADGSTHMVFCSHPFCWSCSNSGLAVRARGGEAFAVRTHQLVQRGVTWDVAGTRVTCRMRVPRVGVFAGIPPVSVWFYDGLECVRPHDENARAVRRPRGYSCEELGGALAGFDAAFPAVERLSYLGPLFVSPHGTGCSRYTDVLATETGLLATWQQARADGSQPLVGHFLPQEAVERILS
ncbi:MAG: exo-alpha-sialidase [Lentisphaeria bacterium]|nr:exo-alpha-sialidase [Lentisphaeria bacterium]